MYELAFRQGKQNCPQYRGVRIKRVSVRLTGPNRVITFLHCQRKCNELTEKKQLLVFKVFLIILLQNRAEYRLILSRRGRRPTWLKPGPYLAGGGGGGGTRGSCPARKTKCFFFSNIVFDFAGFFLVAILVRNLYTEAPLKVCRVCPRRQRIRGTAP